MSIFNVLKTREWVIGRRLILIGILLFVVFRSYGDVLLGWLQQPNAERDIVITRAEFRSDLPGTKPAWIIEFKNQSRRFSYQQIELEATYLDSAGALVERDKLLIPQKLDPGEERLFGSVDFKDRPGAISGSLKVVQASTAD